MIAALPRPALIAALLPDLGKYAVPVLSAYAVAILLLVALTVLSLIRARAARRQLEELEKRRRRP